MAPLEILIAGGGVAGPSLAWWLNESKVSAHVTIIERSPVPRVSGQAVDIRDFGVDVIRRMRLEETIRANATTEEGIEFVWNNGKKKAQFRATGDTSVQSFTSEFEILRGDLARILYEETKDFAEYVFGEYITGIYQEGDGSSKVRITFANGRPEGFYDLVVGADGTMSKTRQMVFGNGPDNNYFLKPLGQWLAFYTIPKIPSDTKFAQWYFTEKGRMTMVRPSQYDDTRVYLSVVDSDLSRFDPIAGARGGGKEEQFAFLEKEFEDAGWQTKRLLQGLRTSQDFYMQETAQVKMAEFVKGRVALLGDAGWCPTPITGLGTTAALAGSYVLAGEISKLPDDIPRALRQYQTTMRPYVDACQKLIPGAPQIIFPQSKLGINMLGALISIASTSVVKKLAYLFARAMPRAFSSKKWSGPEYPAFTV